VLAWSLGALLSFLLIISFLLLIPSIQTKVSFKAAKMISKQTGTKINIGGVHIAFPKTVRIKEIYAEDNRKDTLLYLSKLDIDAALLPLLRKKVSVNSLKLVGLTGKAYRMHNDSSFNFSPIIDAFSTDTKAEKSPGENQSWDITFDEIVLRNIDLDFSDNQDSVYYHLELGHFNLQANEVDLESLTFDLDKIEISETSVYMKMPAEERVESKEENTDNIPLKINVSAIKASSLSYQLDLGSGNLMLKAQVNEFAAEPKLIDLESSTIVMESIETEGIYTILKLTSSDSPEVEKQAEITQSSDHAFGSFDWNFLIKSFRVKNANSKVDLNDEPRLTNGMDYSHVQFNDLSVDADSLYLNRDEAGIKLNSLKLREISGPEIKQLSGDFKMNNTEFLTRDLDFKANSSTIAGGLRLSYPGLKMIGSEIGQLGLNSKLEGKLVFSDAKPFTNIFSSNPTLQRLRQVIIADFETKGSLENLDIKNAEIIAAEDTRLKLSASVVGLPGNNVQLKYDLDTLISSRNDLLSLANEIALPENVQIPQEYRITSQGATNLHDANIDAQLITDLGELKLKFDLQNDQFVSQVELAEIDLGSILMDSTIGKTTLICDAKGSLKDFKPQQFELNATVDYLEWNNNYIEQSTFDLSMENEIYDAKLNVQDSAFSAMLVSQFYQSDSVLHFDSDIEIDKIELQELNLMDEFFEISGQVGFGFEYQNESLFNSRIEASGVDLKKLQNQYKVDQLKFSARVNPEESDFYLHSDFLDASLTGNTRLNELDSAILDHIDLYLSLPDTIISSKDFRFDFDLKLKQAGFFTDFLIPGLHALELEKCQMHYNDAEDRLDAQIQIPKISYENIELSELTFLFDTQADSAMASLNLSEVSLNSNSISNLGMKSVFEKDFARMSLYSKDSENRIHYQLSYSIDFMDSIYKIFINPDNLLINYKKWSIPEDNSLTLSKNQIRANSTQISNDNEVLSLTSTEDEIKLNFKDFKLSNFTDLITLDTALEKLDGNIEGFFEIANLFTAPRFHSHIDLLHIQSDSVSIGDLFTEITYQAEQPIAFKLRLENDENKIWTKGNIALSEIGPGMNANIEINISDANDFQPLMDSYLSNLHGAVAGRLTVSGDLMDPSINGDLNFNDLNTTIAYSNSILTSNGTISVENNVISFKSFQIADAEENLLSFGGLIDFNDMRDPMFDLQIETQDFVLMNSEISRKEVIEGNMTVGLDIKVKGKKSHLNVDNKIIINDGTNIFYHMPGSDLEMITDEGIVEYVDFDNPEEDVIIGEQSAFIGDSLVSLVEGIDFSTSLNIDPNATFTVVVDPNSGDYTEFNLAGGLLYTYKETEKGRLVGRLEFQKGFYELSFYGLVKKRFQYDPGSVVSWSGDVMNGTLNFSARHTVKTNSVGLVSNEISSAEKPLYNQRIPYDVLLNVENKISDPHISFMLDLPERYRSTYPTLDAKLNQLNQPSMEAERNKQVFALLVGGTFIPEDPGISDGAGGSNFATTAARNSVNAIMTQQLNNLTGQFIEGLDVDMGVNTFDDYGTGTAQSRTQLDVKVSKNLFNDRVTAEMESHINLDGSLNQMGQTNTAGMTEFAVAYKLTQEGNYRIKGFRENAYDIFDGEIQNSGIAFIFIKEFDSFRNKSKKNQAEDNQKAVEE